MSKVRVYLISMLIVFLFSACSTPQTPGVVYLSSLRDVEADTPYVFDRDFDGHEIVLNNVNYKKGIAMMNDSEIRFALRDPYNEFNAIVGIGSPHHNYKTALIFSLYGDGKLIYNSKPLSFGKTEAVKVSIKGIKEIALKVESPAKEMTDFAIWADAYLTR